MFSSDIPQADVDGAQCAHDGRATKVGRAAQVLPVVLDPEWVLTHEVVSPLGDDLLGGFEVTPGACLAQASDAGVGVHLDEQVAIDWECLDTSNTHGCRAEG